MDAETPGIRVLVVAKNPLARIGLGALLARQPGHKVVGEVSGDSTLPNDLLVYRPDVIVWDVDWESGPMPFDTLGEHSPPVLALIPDATFAAQAWSGGALGLLLRDSEPEVIGAAITSVSKGLSVLDRVLAQALFPAPTATPHEELELTSREREVLQLLAQGLPNKTIAAQLDISDHTVKFHVNAIMTKLGVQSRTEAVVRAVRLGWVIL